MYTIGQMVACACCVGVALTLTELLTPSVQFQKQLRLIFSMLLLLGVLLPVTKGELSLPAAMQAADAAAAVPDDTLLYDAVAAESEAELTAVLRESLTAAGISVSELSVDVHIPDDGSISIREVRLSCTGAAAAGALLTELLGADVPMQITEVMP